MTECKECGTKTSPGIYLCLDCHDKQRSEYDWVDIRMQSGRKFA